MPAPSVFISYSHQDEVWKDRLVKQLGVPQRQGFLQTWNDRDIRAGDEWFAEIRSAMDHARVAVLLISANSLDSEFIFHAEVPRLLERAQEGLTVFPVLCGDCLWQEVPWLAKLQIRPQDGKPLDSFRPSRRNTELVKIAKEVLAIVRDGSSSTKPSEPVQVGAALLLPTLHQLPSPPGDFTGREEELKGLRSALAKGGTGAIFGLRGMGGIGKTTLALKVAEELTSEYPGAQIYLDLKGVDPQPLTAAQAMAHVIRAFHPEARVSESEAEVSALYRTVLHGKRCLLLMDNAASNGREQVEPLIPPAGSVLLVTSRFHFHLPGLVSRDLDEMPEGESRNLLVRIAPRIENEATEIARLCGRLPLALRLAGSAFEERPNLSPADYIRRLKAGKERFDRVDAALAVSYELLSEERRRLWCLLAVFPGTFDAQAATAVWEIEGDSALDVLGELVRSSLVEWEEKEERYHLHDLARDFAYGQLDSVEAGVGRRRHAEHFLEVLRQANQLYEQGGEALKFGLRLFDAEWGNVQAGQAWAVSHSQNDESAARICDEYPDTGTQYLSLRQHPQERIRWREAALASARRRKDREAEGVHLSNLGLAYADLGETRRAIEFYEQHLAIARDIGDRRSEGNALGNMGIAYKDLGETRRAVEFHEQQLAIARNIGDRRGEGNAIGSLGNAYAVLGETRRAIEFYEQQLAITRDIGDQRGEGTALGNMGVAYKDLGETRRAIELFEQHLAIARDIGDRRGVANASWNLGLQSEKEGDLGRAAYLMQTCVDYDREIGHPDAEKNAAEVAALRARITESGS